MKQHSRHHHMIRYCFGIMIISLFIFGNSACKEQPRNMPEKITFAYSSGIYHSLPYIVHVKRFFADEGLNVVLQHHQIGKADLAISADTPFMFAVFGGKKKIRPGGQSKIS